MNAIEKIESIIFIMRSPPYPETASPHLLNCKLKIISTLADEALALLKPKCETCGGTKQVPDCDNCPHGTIHRSEYCGNKQCVMKPCPDCQEQPKCATCGGSGELPTLDPASQTADVIRCPDCPPEQPSGELIGKMRGIAACVGTDLHFKECLLRAADRLEQLEASKALQLKEIVTLSRLSRDRLQKIERLEKRAKRKEIV